jgi:SP family sugar:H+ symporter-like MFS transporter
VFAGCNILGGLLVYFFVLEGKGRTLEEIDMMYMDKVLPWKSSKYVAPMVDDDAPIGPEDAIANHLRTGDAQTTGDTSLGRSSSSGDTASESREKLGDW